MFRRREPVPTEREAELQRELGDMRRDLEAFRIVSCCWIYGIARAEKELGKTAPGEFSREATRHAVQLWLKWNREQGATPGRASSLPDALRQYIALSDTYGFMRAGDFVIKEEKTGTVCEVRTCPYWYGCLSTIQAGLRTPCFRGQAFLEASQIMTGKKISLELRKTPTPWAATQQTCELVFKELPENP